MEKLLLCLLVNVKLFSLPWSMHNVIIWLGRAIFGPLVNNWLVYEHLNVQYKRRLGHEENYVIITPSNYTQQQKRNGEVQSVRHSTMEVGSSIPSHRTRMYSQR